MTGQSLAVQWDSYGMFSGTIDNRAVYFDGTAYVNNTFGIYGGGRVELGNYFTALLNAPVALVHSALSSTAISTWWNAGKTTAFNNWQAKGFSKYDNRVHRSRLDGHSGVLVVNRRGNVTYSDEAARSAFSHGLAADYLYSPVGRYHRLSFPGRAASRETPRRTRARDVAINRKVVEQS